MALLLSFSSTAIGGDFLPWSENVFIEVEKEYGTDAAKRLRYLHDMVKDNQHLPVMKKLKLVNSTLNHLPWIADQKHWKTADYWATPMETITTFGGDCEDIAIVKWVTLTHMGVSGKHLRLAYARIKQTGESHMVLVYIENPDDEPEKQKGWVLDNSIDEVMRGSSRTDLLVIYITDAQGNLVLIADTGKERSIKGIYKDRRMKKLDDLKKKIAASRLKYQKINDGHPLLPPEF